MSSKTPSPRPVLCAQNALVAELIPTPSRAHPADNVLPFEPSPGEAARPNPGRCPESLTAELLALNLEMIEQLRGERLGVVGASDFIAGMIEQHERAAALLRAQLGSPPADPV